MSESISGGYDLPDISAIELADNPQAAAGEALNRLEADYISDSQHPFWDANHRQHGDFVDRIGQLHRLKAGREGSEPPSSPVHEAMAQGLQEQEQAQENRTSQAHEICLEMEQHGYPYPDDLPSDLTHDEVNLLGLHLRAVKGEDTAEELRLLNTQVGTDMELRGAINDLSDEKNESDKLAMTRLILLALMQKQRAKAGLPPREFGRKQANDTDDDTILGEGRYDDDE